MDRHMDHRHLVSCSHHRAGPARPHFRVDELRRCDGFSFIEVIIVVVILAILATLLIPRVMGRTGEAKRPATKAQISNIENALQLFKLDNGTVPSTEQGLKALVERPIAGPSAPNWKAGGYLPKVPLDPWGVSLQVHDFLDSRRGVRDRFLRRRWDAGRRGEKRRHRQLGFGPQLSVRTHL